jgi:hypothetical protein
MQSKATSVDEYLDALPADRRAIVSAIRDVIRRNLPKGYAEGMQYGMIGWFVPHDVYPAGYHCDPRQPLPFAGLASQKGYVSLYLMCTYGIEAERAWLQDAWRDAGKKLDMGKACIRVKKLEDVPLEVVGQAVKRVPVRAFLAHYESTIRDAGKRKAPAKKAPATKASAGKAAPAQRSAAKKTAGKKPAARKAGAKKAPARKRPGR